MLSDTVVIGAGLFGQVIAAELRRLGHHVIVVDARKPQPGSAPSASLMKPSWFSSMGKEFTDPALETLDRLYGVASLTFKVGPLKTDSVKWCNPRQIMAPPALHDTVTKISGWQGRRRVQLQSGTVLEARHVVLAAGAWSKELRPVPKLEAKMGLSCFWPNQSLDQPFISPWAPYKQMVAFNMNDGVWVGDGSAIKEGNWTPVRSALTVDRCIKAVGIKDMPVITHGARPYVPKSEMDGKPCFLREVDGVWVATGGAKNGTIAAGWAAYFLGERLQ